MTTATKPAAKPAAKTGVYRVEFAGSGVWAGMKHRIIASLDVRANDPSNAQYVAQHDLDQAPMSPIHKVDITRVTVRRMR